MAQPIKSYLIAAAAGLVPPALLWLFNRKKNMNSTSPKDTPAEQARKNLKAFLLTIQYSEGTYGPNAYRSLFGGGLMIGYAQHPNIKNTRWGLTSTAAGAYQILFGTWNAIQQKLGLPDFSPINQDRAAVELIRTKGALEDVVAGRFYAATVKCRKIWASLPGAGYGQAEKKIAQLEYVYRLTGGTITA